MRGDVVHLTEHTAVCSLRVCVVVVGSQTSSAQAQVYSCLDASFTLLRAYHGLYHIFGPSPLCPGACAAKSCEKLPSSVWSMILPFDTNTSPLAHSLVELYIQSSLSLFVTSLSLS